MKMRKVEKLLAKFYEKKKKCYTHKKFELIIKSWISIKKKHELIRIES